MTSVRQLYELQETDREIDQRRQALASIERQLANPTSVMETTQRLEEAKQRLQQLEVSQRLQEVEVEGLREKASALERKMYGGTVTNPRELESLQKELELLRTSVRKDEDSLLEVLVGAEETQKETKGLQVQLEQAVTQWKATEEALKKQAETLTQEVENLVARRSQQAQNMDGTQLKLYESLRAQKGGLAVAKVERGLCQGCRMSLPTHQMQLARSARELVFCNTCGRILYVS